MTAVVMGREALGVILDDVPGDGPPTFWPSDPARRFTEGADFTMASLALELGLRLHYERREFIRYLYALIALRCLMVGNLWPQCVDVTISRSSTGGVDIWYSWRASFDGVGFHSVVI